MRNKNNKPFPQLHAVSESIFLANPEQLSKDYQSKYAMISAARASNTRFIHSHFGGQDRVHNLPQEIKDVMSHFINNNDSSRLLLYYKELAAKNHTTIEEELTKVSVKNGYIIDLKSAYQEIYNKYNNEPEKDFEAFLSEFAEVRNAISEYRKRESAIETKAILSEFLKKVGHIQGVTISNVIPGSNGFKSFYNILNQVLYNKTSGATLVPIGHYHGLVLGPTNYKGTLAIAKEYTPEIIQEALDNRERLGLQAIYFSVVNNPDASIMSKEKLTEIAKVILKYNNENPDKPIYVIDDVTYLKTEVKDGVSITPISSIEIDGLGKMFDWSIAIGSTSKAFCSAGNRFGFATSGNQHLLCTMKEKLESNSVDELSYIAERMGAATLALTNVSFLEKNKEFYKKQIEISQKKVAGINKKFGANILEINNPDGGWNLLLKFNKEHLKAIHNSEEIVTWLINYGKKEKHVEGVSTLAGCLFGYESKIFNDGHPRVRMTLAMNDIKGQKSPVDAFFNCVEDAMIKMRDTDKLSIRRVLKLSEQTASQFYGKTR